MEPCSLVCEFARFLRGAFPKGHGAARPGARAGSADSPHMVLIAPSGPSDLRRCRGWSAWRGLLPRHKALRKRFTVFNPGAPAPGYVKRRNDLRSAEVGRSVELASGRRQVLRSASG
jgi:hypothetical protein